MSSNGVGMNSSTLVSPGYTGYGSISSLCWRSQFTICSCFNLKNMTYTSFTWEIWAYLTNLVNYDNLMSSTIVSVNQWYHFGFVYDYSALTQYVYLNGYLTCTHTSSSPFQTMTGAITIGAINATGAATPSSFWTGYLDQVSYVSKAKTAVEVLDDAILVAYYSFDNGSFYDSGPNGINGTGVSLTSTTG
ncbi:unnamed protein product [Rotaria sp. Silwood2]|nr:unnamed protein product [Rotaria sp. Silwood2]